MDPAARAWRPPSRLSGMGSSWTVSVTVGSRPLVSTVPSTPGSFWLPCAPDTTIPIVVGSSALIEAGMVRAKVPSSEVKAVGVRPEPTANLSSATWSRDPGVPSGLMMRPDTCPGTGLPTDAPCTESSPAKSAMDRAKPAAASICRATASRASARMAGSSVRVHAGLSSGMVSGSGSGSLSDDVAPTRLYWAATFSALMLSAVLPSARARTRNTSRN